MGLYKRNYLVGLTPQEQLEYQAVKEKVGRRRFGRINLSHQYSLALRNCLSLFPNNHLDIVDLKKPPNIEDINRNFEHLISSDTANERDIINYINTTPAFHIIGSILQGCHFHFAHHQAYLFPEFPLGTSYRADYLIIGKSSGGHEFVFVELESPNGNAVLKDGNLGSAFRKGITQISDWQRWLQENYSNLSEYFRMHCNRERDLPKEFTTYDSTRLHYVVVAGRRQDFNDKTYWIARTHKDNMKIHLLHYDNLYDFAMEILNKQTY